MANDTYVPITICIYLSGCILALALVSRLWFN